MGKGEQSGIDDEALVRAGYDGESRGIFGRQYMISLSYESDITSVIHHDP